MSNNKHPLMKKFILFSIIFFLIIVISGSFAFVLSMQQIIRSNKGSKLSQKLAIERIFLENSMASEITLVMKLADSPIVKHYFLNPSDPELREAAFDEMESYRRAFLDNIVFWANDIDRIFYSGDNTPYWIDAEDPVNYWFNMTLYETEDYNFNINYNPDLNQINLWINAPVFDSSGTSIGIVGTGIELTEFINSIYYDMDEKTQLYYFNVFGEISGAKDIDLVVNKVYIRDELNNININILEEAKNLSRDEIQIFDVPGGTLAIGTVPKLEWYSVAFMPHGINDYDLAMTALFLVVLVLVFVIFVVFNVFINIVLKSLRETMTSLKHARYEAEEANRSKTNFLATMSHEIRTPLNAIIGIAQIQIQEEVHSQKYSESLEKIYSSGNNLLGIINDILDMSKIETGKLELNPEEYEIPSLINDAVQLNIVRLGSKPINVVLDIDENLPFRLLGDELRLKQILNNLLSNAIKYTEKGQVKLSVNHTPDGNEIKLRFVVEDTGQGMKPEDQKKLFSEYLRFNADANRATEGTGLGLHITKRLVEMMHGKITVESEYGKGSTFTVEVKQKVVSASPIGKELACKLCNHTFSGEKQTAKLQISREPMPYGSVLVVDDVDTNLFVAEGLLQAYELQVETAISGFVTLDKVKSGKRYDIIFMDHMMPQMDGIETTKKLREMGYTGTIVALTANALVGNEDMFAQHGFDGFISKPIDVRYMGEILNRFIRDRYPHEAGKHGEKTAAVANTEINPKLMQIFRSDAEKTIVTLQKAIKSGDIKLFNTAVHAMKAALANVGETRASFMAAELEEAGFAGNTDSFIKTLEKLIDKFKINEVKINDVNEDADYLKSQLMLIQAACENYDDDAAYSALDSLKEKQWRHETAAALEAIRDKLYIYSDFDGAAKLTQELL
ncbi:MAG: ATP-binding protein [Oscillospiraceae bacterium]|nr:ATP-binding protein [Oscillospiraceae bacterium]